MHSELALTPDPFGPRERALAELLARRTALAHALGEEVATAIALGEAVIVAGEHPEPTVDAPLDEVDPEPPPAPEVAPPPILTVLPEPPGEDDETVEAPRSVVPPRPPAPPGPSLAEVLRRFGRPEPCESEPGRFLSRLLVATQDPDAWLGFPRDVQQSLVGLASALARHLQDEAGVVLGAAVKAELDSWFSRMTRWSKEHKPGFVPGLSRNNPPDEETWLADARVWWERLDRNATPVRQVLPMSWRPDVAPVPVETDADRLRQLEAALRDPTADLAAPIQKVIDGGIGQRDPRLLRLLVAEPRRVERLPGFKTLKSALRKHGRPDSEPPARDDAPDPIVPRDWPLRAYVRGKNVTLIGGDRRPEAAERLKAAFGFASVTWEETEERRGAALSARVRSGSVDLLLLFRSFLHHTLADAMVEAAKDSGTDFAVVDIGYGVNQVKLALERYLGGRINPVGAIAR